MPKKESIPQPAAAEIRSALLDAMRTTTGPATAAQISKLLVEPCKLTEKKLTPFLEECVENGALRLIPASTAKGKPRYWDRDVTLIARSAIVSLMEQAPEPLTAKEIATQIVSPVKFTEGDLTPILFDQVALQVLHAIPAKTSAGKPRFWNRDVAELIRLTVLQTLNSKGPQSIKDLLKNVKGLGEAQFQSHFEELLKRRVVYEHPPLGKKGKTLFGSQPPTPEPYLREVGAALAPIVNQLRSAQVPVEALRRALVQMIEAAGIPFGKAPGSTTSGNESNGSINLVELMCRIEPSAERGALVGSRELRRAAGIEKIQFDRAVLELSRVGRLSLHRHDYVASLTADERDELVTDGKGAYYVGMALRQNSDA